MNDTKGAIGRKRKKNGFTQVSNSMLEDERLSWRAKGLLCYMLSRPNNWKINKTDLYKRATEGRDAMQKTLTELKQFNYLHIYPNVISQGQIDGWIWEYDDVPFTPEILENQTTEKQQLNEEIRSIPSRLDFQNDGFSERRVSSTYNNTDLNNTDFNNTDSKDHLKHTSISPEKKAQSSIEKEFEQLWTIYPRKIGKKKAFDSYKKARKMKKIPYEIIEKGLYRYITYLEQRETDEQFIQHASTWFNQEKWQDDYTCATAQRKAKNPLDLYKMEFGGNQDEFRGNAQVVEHYQGVIPDFL